MKSKNLKREEALLRREKNLTDWNKLLTTIPKENKKEIEKIEKKIERNKDDIIYLKKKLNKE